MRVLSCVALRAALGGCASEFGRYHAGLRLAGRPSKVTPAGNWRSKLRPPAQPFCRAPKTVSVPKTNGRQRLRWSFSGPRRSSLVAINRPLLSCSDEGADGRGRTGFDRLEMQHSIPRAATARHLICVENPSPLWLGALARAARVKLT
jgi:hypothetical protein